MAQVTDEQGKRRDATELIVTVLSKLNERQKEALANVALGMQISAQTMRVSQTAVHRDG